MLSPTDLQRMLVLDASSRRVCVGLFDADGALHWETSDEDASLSLFPLVKDLLQRHDLALTSLNSIAYCEGPGSMLGIRTVIMGIRAWQGAGFLADKPIYSFSSLGIGAELVRAARPTAASFLVLTDARRQSWNVLKVEGPDSEPIQIIANASLESETLPLFSFDEFPTWTRTQAPITLLPYCPETVFATPAFPTLLAPNPDAEPLDLRAMEFAKWNPVARTADQIDP